MPNTGASAPTGASPSSTRKPSLTRSPRHRQLASPRPQLGQGNGPWAAPTPAVRALVLKERKRCRRVGAHHHGDVGAQASDRLARREKAGLEPQLDRVRLNGLQLEPHGARLGECQRWPRSSGRHVQAVARAKVSLDPARFEPRQRDGRTAHFPLPERRVERSQQIHKCPGRRWRRGHPRRGANKGRAPPRRQDGQIIGAANMLRHELESTDPDTFEQRNRQRLPRSRELGSRRERQRDRDQLMGVPAPRVPANTEACPHRFVHGQAGQCRRVRRDRVDHVKSNREFQLRFRFECDPGPMNRPAGRPEHAHRPDLLAPQGVLVERKKPRTPVRKPLAHLQPIEGHEQAVARL